MQFPAWDPVLFDIPGLPIDIRWYGLMYVVGFVVGQWILVRLARRGFFPVRPEVAPDLVFYCVFGVMLGGRTGYALFYDQSLLNPLNFVQVWKGGLSFHGGLGGVAVALWLFCRRQQVSWKRTADACALAATPGIFAVRFANFINGELYGQVTRPDTPFAMQFPTDPTALDRLGIRESWSMRDRELCIQVAFGKRSFADVQPYLSTADDYGRPIDWAAVAPKLDWQRVSAELGGNGEPLVPYRHPSQLYEGIGEGLLLGLALLVVYMLTRHRPLRPGRFAVLFLIGYALFRGSLEFVRQPDAHLGVVFAGMTMGQLLSGGMVIGALVMLAWRSPPADAARPSA
ncbi:MAG: prolipoprotein diacylglyceryl transferase [Planctomycetes bacterium]|jgi:phosphatidylglycerol:prolipoprotein diacylglycerol transferase|nr:prolipoprotein diacylglyceryl transferase [Planctomycetota bacterium]